MANNNGESGAAAPAGGSGSSPGRANFTFWEAQREAAQVLSPPRAAAAPTTVMESAVQATRAAMAAAAPNASGALSANRFGPYENTAATAATVPSNHQKELATATVQPDMPLVSGASIAHQ